MQQIYPIVDLFFPVRGATIPADHGYSLYAAISRHLSGIHDDEAAGIHPIRGRLVGQRLLALTRASRLVLRIPVAKVSEAIRLAGRSLRLADSSLLVGVPTTKPLIPASTLLSRLVVIRGFIEADAFLEAARRQLANLEVAGDASLVLRTTSRPVGGRTSGGDRPYISRTLRIHDKEVVGFAVRVAHLSADESIRLQEAGLGGQRRFGCGLFFPDRHRNL